MLRVKRLTSPCQKCRTSPSECQWAALTARQGRRSAGSGSEARGARSVVQALRSGYHWLAWVAGKRHAAAARALWWYMLAPDATTVRLLGRPAVLCEDGPVEPAPGRTAALLYYLALHGGWVGRSDLVYLFWPDVPESVARGNLRSLLWRLTNEPYARGLERQRARVRWQVRTDVQDLRDALRAHRWREAWDLGRKELLSGFTVAGAPEFEAWLEAERAELRVSVRQAGMRVLDALESTGGVAEAALLAAALHRDDPLDEAATRRWLVALARAGERSAALAAFDGFRRLLADELGAEPEGETVRLVEAIRTGSEAFRSVADRTAVADRTPSPRAALMIPRQPTRFVGRDREVAELMEGLLDDASGLLTIVGPGGVGKTRLATEVASRVAPRFAHGARFVDLAAMHDTEAVLVTVARAVGAEPRLGREAARSIGEHLGDAVMLLVLDNAEQVAEAARELITELAACAPGVRILATSRLRLGHRGERVFDLLGLPFGAAEEGSPSEAVTLFVRAARRIRPDVTFTPGELECVRRICEVVGGLPLALELAATWLRVLSVAEIEAELAAGPELLEGVTGDAPRRHAGMRTVFDHSWSLLRGREQQALRALAVFRGGWTREAAAAVADVGTPVHLALRDASLIWRDASGRFGWHPLVEQYAGERADEHPAERDAVIDRHARHFLGLLAERQLAWRGDEGARRLAEVEIETANLVFAWRGVLARGQAELLTEALRGLTWLIAASGRVGLYVQLVHELLALVEPGSLLHGRAVICLGAASTWRGVGPVDDEVVASLQEAIDVLQRHDAVVDAAYAHRYLGMALLRLGRVVEGREVWQRAKALHEALGDGEGVTMMLNNLGDTAPTFEEAVAGLRAAIASGFETGALFPAALASDGLGHTLFRRHGAVPEAVAALEQAVDLAARTGFSHVEQRDRRMLVEVLAAGGELVAARAAIEQALARCDPSGGEQVVQDRLAARALQSWVAWLAGDGALAARAALAALERPSDLSAGAAALPPESEALARLVVGRLALELGEAGAAAVELRLARAARARIPRGPGTWHDHMAEEPEAADWARLLAVETELALATGRHGDARSAAGEALRIALRSEQEPAGAVALVIAAGVLVAGGEAAAARELVAFVRRHPATPFEAQRMVERLEAADSAATSAAEAVPAADGASSPRSLGEVIEDTLERI
jgi:predicted ATPase/DNA-binding SARP family transcriptional activator